MCACVFTDILYIYTCRTEKVYKYKITRYSGMLFMYSSLDKTSRQKCYSWLDENEVDLISIYIQQLETAI